LFNPIGAHSRKPEAQYDIAEGYPGPYLEIFCHPRSEGLWDWQRPGWKQRARVGREMQRALEI
jgi:hypothetical protein